MDRFDTLTTTLQQLRARDAYSPGDLRDLATALARLRTDPFLLPQSRRALLVLYNDAVRASDAPVPGLVRGLLARTEETLVRATAQASLARGVLGGLLAGAAVGWLVRRS